MRMIINVKSCAGDLDQDAARLSGVAVRMTRGCHEHGDAEPASRSPFEAQIGGKSPPSSQPTASSSPPPSHAVHLFDRFSVGARN